MQFFPRTKGHYPFGAAPGVPHGHIALRGSTLRCSAIATNSGVGFIAIYSASKGGTAFVNTGGFTSGVTDGYMGNVVSSSATGTTNRMTLSGQAAVTDSTITMAAIVKFTSTATTQAIWCLGDSGSVGWVIQSNAGTLELAPAPFTTAASSGVAFSTNTPYFCAASGQSANTNFVVKNLITGLARTANATTAMTATASNGNYVIGNYGNDANSIAGSVACVMAATGTPILGQKELLQWADDPWSFWFPADSQEQLVSWSAIDIKATAWERQPDTAEIVGY